MCGIQDTLIFCDSFIYIYINMNVYIWFNASKTILLHFLSISAHVSWKLQHRKPQQQWENQARHYIFFRDFGTPKNDPNVKGSLNFPDVPCRKYLPTFISLCSWGHFFTFLVGEYSLQGALLWIIRPSGCNVSPENHGKWSLFFHCIHLVLEVMGGVILEDHPSGCK